MPALYCHPGKNDLLKEKRKRKKKTNKHQQQKTPDVEFYVGIKIEVTINKLVPCLGMSRKSTMPRNKKKIYLFIR